ncbi:unnamed protein product [Clonostachys solani]|uniref:Uncharacterized protein n=1 Tax=Clonostachys solani TaxID=160281 RepID=A0A9N9W8S0_9HYPO|nr:unnamed protein product [Clonostachys solani]
MDTVRILTPLARQLVCFGPEDHMFQTQSPVPYLRYDDIARLLHPDTHHGARPTTAGATPSSLLRNSTISSVPTGELNQCPPSGYSLHSTLFPSPPNRSSVSLNTLPSSTLTTASSTQCCSITGVLHTASLTSPSSSPLSIPSIPLVAPSDRPGNTIRHETPTNAPSLSPSPKLNSTCAPVAPPWLIPITTTLSQPPTLPASPLTTSRTLPTLALSPSACSSSRSARSRTFHTSNHCARRSVGFSAVASMGAAGNTHLRPGNASGSVWFPDVGEYASDEANLAAESPRPWRKITVWVWGGVGSMMVLSRGGRAILT